MIKLLAFVLGLVFGVGGLLFLMGPTARTILRSHIATKPLAIIPCLDRTMQFKRFKTLPKGRLEIPGLGLHKLDQRKVYITGGKVPTVIIPEGVGTNFTPEDAELAERTAKGAKNPKIKIGRENVSFNDLVNQVKEIMGADHLADVLMLSRSAYSPITPSENRRGTVIKIAGIGMVLAVIIIGVVLARQFGFV